MLEVKVSGHSIQCKNASQVRAAQMIGRYLPMEFRGGPDFKPIVFFVNPKNRMAVEVCKPLTDVVISNLEKVNVKLIKYTYWTGGRISAGVFEY